MSNTTDSLPGFLSSARYGKDLVRVARVVREGDKHHIVEYTVKVMLEGEIENSYTKADNSCVVATDTMKNTVYVLAKTSPHVLSPPLFALHLSLHFLTEYPHISSSHIEIIVHRWSRIKVANTTTEGEVNGNENGLDHEEGQGEEGLREHGWAFVRDGEEKGLVKVGVERGGEGGKGMKGKVQVGLKDLLVLKTNNSSFTNFQRDAYTTLQEVTDRIFSTTVALMYDVILPEEGEGLTIEGLKDLGQEIGFEKIYSSTRQISLEVFANDQSASVQATMYNTAQAVLSANPAIGEISYEYPNKHYIPVNLAPFGLDNGLGREGGAEVFHPVADPSGLITATVTRKSKGK